MQRVLMIKPSLYNTILKPRIKIRYFHITPQQFKLDNPWDILGISPTSNIDEIRKAYISKAKKYHPDTNKSPEALAVFQKIQSAYEMVLENIEPTAVKEEPGFSSEDDYEFYTKIRRDRAIKKEEKLRDAHADIIEMFFYIIAILLITNLMAPLADKWDVDRIIKKHWGENYDKVKQEYDEKQRKKKERETKRLEKQDKQDNDDFQPVVVNIQSTELKENTAELQNQKENTL